MTIDPSQPVAKIVTDAPAARAVLEALGIDYSCTGDLTLEDAAHAAGLDPHTVVMALGAVREDPHPASWNDRPLGDLTRHLTEQHHHFVREELAKVSLQLADACMRPLPPQHDMFALRVAIAKFSDLVLRHLHHEERGIFREIEALETAWQANEAPEIDGGVRARTRVVLEEHSAIDAQLRVIRDLRLRLATTEDLPPRCRSILASIAALEAHLHEAMFLENCVLLPRALTLEEQMTANVQP